MSSLVERSVTSAPAGTAERRQQIAEVVRRYTVERESIRAISRASGWSYGKTHRLLRESGTPMRPRGGFHPRHVPAARHEARATLPAAGPSV